MLEKILRRAPKGMETTPQMREKASLMLDLLLQTPPVPAAHTTLHKMENFSPPWLEATLVKDDTSDSYRASLQLLQQAASNLLAEKGLKHVRSDCEVVQSPAAPGFPEMVTLSLGLDMKGPDKVYDFLSQNRERLKEEIGSIRTLPRREWHSSALPAGQIAAHR